MLRKNRKLIYDIGVNDADYVTRPTIGGKQVWCPFYQTWRGMLKRCYCAKFHETHPTYLNCTVAPVWHSFMKFRDWMETQDWEGNELDKDIFQAGNKVYGPDTCLFVSRQVNSLLNDHGAKRGKYPIGVNLHHGRYPARIRLNGKRKHLGRFDTPAEAANAYAGAKADCIRHIARQQSDNRVVGGLLRHATLYEQGAVS